MTVDGTFRHQMGLRRLEPAGWLELTHPNLVEQLAKKQELMAARPDELLAVLPGFEAAAIEVQDLISDEFALQRQPPPIYDSELHPLDAAARVVREDLCLHDIVDDELVLVAGSVCFPTRWTLAEKVGRPISVIHKPVPGLADDIGDRIDSFVSRLRPGVGSGRSNWSILPTDELCLPGHHRDLPVVDSPEKLWLRTERQTLRRLPVGNGVLFTIGIDVQPLPIFRMDRWASTELADRIEALSEPFRAYKGLTNSHQEIVDYLRS